MKKEIYSKAEIEIISFTATDVLTNSPYDSDSEDDLPFVPVGNQN